MFKGEKEDEKKKLKTSFFNSAFFSEETIESLSAVQLEIYQKVYVLKFE